jgi:rhodanese-related sulfurtransferase
MEKKGKKSLYSLIAFFMIIAILIAGYVLIMPSEIEYQLSNEEMLDEVLTTDYRVYPEDVAYFAETEDEGYFLVDLRDPHSYQTAHIGNAVNIPVHDLLENENRQLFDRLAEDSAEVILYGNDQLEANGGWMLLRQLGYSNVKIMPGGYNYYSKSSLDLYDLPEIPEYMVEEPMFDFAGIMEEMSGGDFQAKPAEQPEMVVPVRKKKKTVVEGGC